MIRGARPSPSSVRGVAVLVLSALAGCATVARARSVQDPASAVPGERTPTAAEVGLPTKGVVTMQQVVRTALRIHPSVVAARRAAEAAAARVREAEAYRYAQLSIDGASAYRNGSDTKSDEHHFRSYGFDVSWLLFDFGQSSALRRQAAEDWLAAQADVSTAEVAAALVARAAFFELQKRIDLLATDREAVRQFQEHLDQVREQVSAGVKGRIPYDVSKAEVDLGNSRLTEVEARDAVLSGNALLASAVGLAEVVDWTPAPVAAALPIPKDFDAAWATARAKEPSLAAAVARERAASALVDARVAALYPSLSLSLAYSKSGLQMPLPWGLSAGPSIQWTPFNGYENLASIDETVASLRAARAAGAAAEQRVWLEVRTAWVAIADAKERFALTELTVKSAQEGLRLAQGRFDAGLATSVDLTDSRTALIQAQTDRIQAQADYFIAAARLAKAVGVAMREP